jgi:thiamine-monophosphate kinase
VAVALPKGMTMTKARAIHAGMQALAEPFACPLIGGDVTSWAHPLAITVTVLGQSPANRQPVLRSGARVGDGVYLSGPVGGSLLGRHLTFTPRVELADRLAAAVELHAMIDVSDGVATDLQHICTESGVGAEIDAAAMEMMIHADAERAATQDERSALDHALQDGEDFELLVATEQDLEALKLDDSLRCIGRVVADGLWLLRSDGRREPLAPHGYEHFT